MFVAPILVLALLAGLPLGAQPRRVPGPLHPRVSRGGNPFERLNKMTPEQRQRMLDRLPPDRRAKAQERLDRFERMSPEERERLAGQYETFQRLTPQQQEVYRRAFRRFSSMPEDRQKAIRAEYDRLKQLSADERKSRFESDEFRKSFNKQEQMFLGRIAELNSPPFERF